MKTTVIITRIAALLSLLALLGCTVGPDYQRPPVDAPGAYRDLAASAAPVPDAPALADRPWWELFDDPTLAALIDEALAQAHDARLAAWRVEEARAALGLARSEFFPGIEASASAGRDRPSAFEAPPGATRDRIDVRVGLAWEIDLWGRIRRETEAARARYLATEEARRGVLLSLVSDVASAYFELRALDVELDIARQATQAFDETRRLFDDRLDAGLASALETSSARAALTSNAAAIPDLERRIAAQEHRIALLLGRNPEAVPRGAELDAQTLPPAIPAGIPSELLRRRPDLRRAEQELVAANAEVGAAIAAYFPSIRLTGAFGGVSSELSGLFSDGKTWSAAGGVVSPLFQGRRLQNQHRAAEARLEQAKVQFERDVTRAFGEVSTALVAYARLADVEDQRQQAVEAHREAVELARSRYLSGLADYLEVLQAQRQLYPAEVELTRTRLERLATLVTLYRALGGGWQLEDDAWLRADARG